MRDSATLALKKRRTRWCRLGLSDHVATGLRMHHPLCVYQSWSLDDGMPQSALTLYKVARTMMRKTSCDLGLRDVKTCFHQTPFASVADCLKAESLTRTCSALLLVEFGSGKRGPQRSGHGGDVASARKMKAFVRLPNYLLQTFCLGSCRGSRRNSFWMRERWRRCTFGLCVG